MKRYIVTSTQTPHGPIYQILDKVTGAVIESTYKCQIWAEREAERMERKMDTIGNRLNGLLSERKREEGSEE